MYQRVNNINDINNYIFIGNEIILKLEQMISDLLKVVYIMK